MIYFICYNISAFFIWLGNLKTNRRKSSRIILFEIVGILLLVLLAAFRDTCVGADVNYYVVPYFNRAVLADSFLQYRDIASGDILYDFLNYSISRFTTDIFWLFFFVELLILIFIYLGCKNYSSKIKPWFSMLIFYFLFYQFTLTTVRQSCALAICFFTFSLVIKEKFLKKIVIISHILIIIAMGFHSSAIAGFLILWFIYFIVKKEPRKVIIISNIIIIEVILYIFRELFLNKILETIGFFNQKYLNSVYSASGGVGASGYSILILLGIIALIVLILNLRKKTNDIYWRNINTAMTYLILIYIFTLLFINGFTYLARIAYYFQYFEIIALAQFEQVVSRKNNGQIMAKAIVLMVVMVFWGYYFIHGGVTNTYPYILGGR